MKKLILSILVIFVVTGTKAQTDDSYVQDNFNKTEVTLVSFDWGQLADVLEIIASLLSKSYENAM